MSPTLLHASPRPRKAALQITAVEEDEEDHHNNNNFIPRSPSQDDVIPGPPPDLYNGGQRPGSPPVSPSRQQQRSTSIFTRLTGRRMSGNSALASSRSGGGGSTSADELQLSGTGHYAGGGILASRADLEMDPKSFASGCNLLQAAAIGNLETVSYLITRGVASVNFRDYDRRTALHVAASEGHLPICQYLINQGARINRSDRWGGSPLDDAHRHRQTQVIALLRMHGATTGSGNRLTNLITAASQGDVDEVRMLLQGLTLDTTTPAGGSGIAAAGATATPVDADASESNHTYNTKQRKSGLDVNKGDYDKRTALHLAAGEGHAQVVQLLLQVGADPNVMDRWERRPLDDAEAGKHEECIKLLKTYGAIQGTRKLVSLDSLDTSGKRLIDNLKVNFDEIEMVDRIGSGAFGEIYKCRWRGTLVAAKIIKSAKIRRDWVNKRAMQSIKDGGDVDDAVRDMDEAEMEQDEKDLALADFRQEISVLKSLRHPHIVLLLAYSTTEDYECLISELAKCSLLDVFKSHIVQGTRMAPRTQIAYATQLALGMNYLHTCKPPIIHRDLKPANLLLDHSGVLKVSDFGLAKVRPDLTTMESDTFNMTGETGSYRFMSVEVYRHEHYNEMVDVYSFAMILFYLLVGRPPWPNLSGLQAVRKAAEEGDRPTIPRDMDVRMQNLLKECWSENPNARPPFSTIVDVLARYNQDVFKVSTTSVVSVNPQPGAATCGNCVIL